MKGAYYNEIVPFAAQWLRNLIRAGHIAPGDVDERDIRDVNPDDLIGFKQCHFFAGIGTWSYSARLAGWGDDDPLWTASCPCQPFSAAGAGGGFADERHLWPHFHHLVRERRPHVVVGEQVASKDGLAWLDLVQDDMEGEDYAFGALDHCSAGYGAPHIRQRLYWVAYTASRNPGAMRVQRSGQYGFEPENVRSGGVAYAQGERLFGRQDDEHGGRGQRASGPRGAAGGVADPGRGQQQPGGAQPDQWRLQACDGSGALGNGGRPGPANGFWRDADWLACTDERWRPVEPGTFPLAHGVASRMGLVRAYGNAINTQQATAFLEAVKACLP
jgi:DNA (cytosine-5)-methyltransferase 1